MVADKSVKTMRGAIVVERPEVLARLAGGFGIS
jgi:hypothetical protein